MQKVFLTVILLGILQGVIVTALLLFSKLNKKPNRILALLIWLITLAIFNLYGNNSNWFGSPALRDIAQVIPMIFVMPVGPLIWLYVQSLLNPDFKILKKQRRHFYPVLVDLVPSLTIIIYIFGRATNLFVTNPGPWANFLDNYNVYADIPRWLSVSWYVWLSAKYLSAHKTATGEKTHVNKNNFKWLMQFTRVFMVFQSIWLLYLVPYVIPRFTGFMLDTFNWYPVYIPMAVLIYWLGIKGYNISYQQTAADKKMKANNLTPEQIAQAVTALTKAMEKDKAYLNPDLNLASMCRMTGLPAKTISAVLNQHLQSSFNAFVNGYRIEEFKDKLSKSGWQHLKISALAAESGFNSQATFQRAFKELMHISPSEYMKSAALNTQIEI
ncbi:MAG: AraC-type DNA-binding protein [Chitinophagaceae bacterium]|nr:AraC-type DNA-binding protein [Chitinophagaceae bacterium]